MRTARNIGVTADLAKRMAYHANTEHDSFAHRYNCDRLIHVERFQDYESAIRREKQLKGRRGAKNVALIYSVNPHWRTIPIG
jgi:putative endonuclease